MHFVTGTFLEELQHLRSNKPSKLIAYVLMPDHFHLIVNPRDGNIREWTGSLKSLSAKRLIEVSPQKLERAMAEWDKDLLQKRKKR